MHLSRLSYCKQLLQKLLLPVLNLDKIYIAEQVSITLLHVCFTLNLLSFFFISDSCKRTVNLCLY